MNQSKPPRFSIIINVYNGEKYLPEAIDSALAQTYTDWELIIWDNKSTDNTAAICRQFADDRIRYYCAPEHTPVGPARDRTIRLAKGEWLAFLDHDDIWAPNKLAAQSRLIDQDTSGKLGIVYGWTVQFDESGKEKAFDRWHAPDNSPEGDIFRELISKPTFVSYSSAVLLRSAALEILGIPPSVNLNSDYYLTLMVARSHLAARVTETCCWYRKHKASISHSGKSKITMHHEVLYILELCRPEIDARLVDYRKRVHMTHIGVLEIITGEAVFRGLIRILVKGSWSFLLSRPFTLSRRYYRRLRAAEVKVV